MTPQTIILMGPSGSGKGTQAKLLEEYLTKEDPGRTHLVMQTGKRFRDLAAKGGFVGERVKAVIEEGGLVPHFLTVWAWGSRLIEEFAGEEHLIFDGTPRKLPEAVAFRSALQFLGRENPLAIVIEVGEKWARTRLGERGRSDDRDEDDISRRLAWYQSDVVPVIDFFEKDDGVHVVRVNGEQTIEEVHQELVEKAFKL